MKYLTTTERLMICAIVMILAMMAHGSFRMVKLRNIEHRIKAGTSSYEERVYYKKYHRVTTP